jgi:hypothetical protein
MVIPGVLPHLTTKLHRGAPVQRVLKGRFFISRNVMQIEEQVLHILPSTERKVKQLSCPAFPIGTEIRPSQRGEVTRYIFMNTEYYFTNLMKSFNFCSPFIHLISIAFIHIQLIILV